MFNSPDVLFETFLPVAKPSWPSLHFIYCSLWRHIRLSPIRVGYYWFTTTTGTGFQTFDAFWFEAFYPWIYWYICHSRLFTNGFRCQTSGFQKDDPTAHAESIAFTFPKTFSNCRHCDSVSFIALLFAVAVWIKRLILFWQEVTL